ncbi:flagellar basal body rod protein FlgC [Tatumella sp. TA1]|uniref:flagellar basal body rod protein FlgC n=1 Tax=Rosenbergiella collisarenosi TaxID=1544695 RepID=UPI0008F8F15F|nr:flagellar basal body rod protein FlgC [Rosenbergiella collisarenosi]MBT0721891.1 flagellar basal body rod protein FlgC [Rosenbergiella collisarenosi]QGX93194.1 flagellar basal body rod protein FlgC [Tatumella sp. TA1]
MGFNAIYQIAGSAMNAQMIRLNTVASNLANADTPATSADGVYQARVPVFSTVYHQAAQADTSSAGVAVTAINQQPGSVARYEPNHPLADAQGYVYYPAINTVDQMADMMSASRSFETNVDVLTNVKSMQQSLLRLGEAT